jgi:hypothetical protein
MKAARKLRKLQQPQTLIDDLRPFLTPQVWKQARQAPAHRRRLPRWDLQPLLIIALAMTWAVGDSEAEKFETACGFYISAHEARKRPGKTLPGFQKVLARIPMCQLRALAAGVRDQIRTRFAERLLVDGFVPMGCDGSRIECPRSAQLEARLGESSKRDSAPTIWLTAFVHLSTGLLWSWQVGPGTADERLHLRRLLATLAQQALIVADAAYMGYALARAIIQSQRSFPLRVSSKLRLYTMEHVPLERWEEGTVYYRPDYVQKEQGEPIVCRLIRIKARGGAKKDVWLLTNVLDPTRLPLATASRFYRWRWRNGGLFRTYKRTLNKLKLSSRTVRLVHREAEVSLLAVQILLAHAELALRSEKSPEAPAISPRKVLTAIRQELQQLAQRRARSYGQRLGGCRAEPRNQTSSKTRREWPRRKPHKAPQPPMILTLDDEQKSLLQQHLDAA